MELLGPEQTPQQIREQQERAQELGEAGLTAIQSHPTSNELSPPFSEALPAPPTDGHEMHIDRAQSPHSPHLLPHSPTRSTRSVTPVVGSYFGTGQAQQEHDRRGSYFSIFSAGQPVTPRSSRTDEVHPDDDAVDFWGGQSRGDHEADIELPDTDEEESSSTDEAMSDEDDEEEIDNDIELLGHR